HPAQSAPYPADALAPGRGLFVATLSRKRASTHRADRVQLVRDWDRREPKLRCGRGSGRPGETPTFGLDRGDTNPRSWLVPWSTISPMTLDGSRTSLRLPVPHVCLSVFTETHGRVKPRIQPPMSSKRASQRS